MIEITAGIKLVSSTLLSVAVGKYSMYGIVLTIRLSFLYFWLVNNICLIFPVTVAKEEEAWDAVVVVVGEPGGVVDRVEVVVKRYLQMILMQTWKITTRKQWKLSDGNYVLFLNWR